MRRFIIAGSAFAVAIAGLFLSVAIYISKNADNDNKKRSDVILVLGSRAYHNGKWDACLFSRVSHAAELYKAHYAPLMIVSGGVDRTGFNEALAMKDMALFLGVPEKAILLEPAAKSTWENMILSQKMMRSRDLSSLVIVTEPYHSPRAALIAEKMGLAFTVSPTTSSPCWNNYGYFSRYFIRELAAMIWYKLKNRI